MRIYKATMTNPFAPPGDTDSRGGHRAHELADAARRHRWLIAIDLLLIVGLALFLLPAVILNVTLWIERLLEMGIFDPAIGGDPAWRARPLLTPLVVAAAGAARLALARRYWPTGPLWAYVVLLSLALVTAAAAQIPEPNFFANWRS